MGRLKKKDKEEADQKIDETKDLMSKVNSGAGVDLSKVFDLIKGSSEDDGEEISHIPMHTLQEIKKKLGEKKVVKNDEGEDILTPLYTEEEKVKVIFGLLSEKGLNLLDFLEKTLAETGYNGKVLFSINETMSKTTEILRDIAEMQYRKAKLENERIHLEIQKYKADLKKREIEIKENDPKKGSGGNNIIAVGNINDLMKIMNGNEDVPEATIVEEENKED